MQVDLEPGRYVVAVSGGVDSVSLLNILSNIPGVVLTVAHFDHGIRDDSVIDRKLVGDMAKQLKLPFVYEAGKLGPGTSETTAREARYNFLRKVQAASGAQALITAHHQDDLIETAIINILRGTGRKGISSLADYSHLRRPLLKFSKAEIEHYAAEQGLVWREDSTNQDTTILRNYIRKVLLPKLGLEGRKTLLNYINHIDVVNRALDNELSTYLHMQPARQSLNRLSFIELPHEVALEVLASWLRSHGITNFDSKMLEKITADIKTLSPGKQIDLNARQKLLVGNEVVALVNRYQELFN